jgi:putative transcriptional regulator
MIDHTEDGAFGLVINRPIGKTIAELWKEILKDETTCRSAVHWGGPVDGQLMVLHSIRALADAEILPGVYLSTTKTNVDSVIESDPPHSRFFIGYAGWSAGQLETEIEEGAWEVVPA